jgi:putative tricarboxylic transport membrane protein
MRIRRVVVPLAGVLLVIALLDRTRSLDDVAREGGLGPGFWPRLALSGLGVSCAWKVLQELRSHRGRVAMTRVPMARGTLAVGVALLVLYTAAIPVLGFPLATATFIVAFMTLAGARSVPALAASGVIGTLALVYLFVKLVYLPLPKGDGPFETLTLALYHALRVF